MLQRHPRLLTSTILLTFCLCLGFLFLVSPTALPAMPTISAEGWLPQGAGDWLPKGAKDLLPVFSPSGPRVLCWINTHPPNHAKKAVHVKATWGKRCDTLLFMSTEEDKELGAVAIQNHPVSQTCCNITSGRASLWNKTKTAFNYIWENHRDDADWFIKVDDDTYLIMENLKHLLKDYDTQTALFFGHRFKYFGGYMAGGSGYVLSKAALQAFAGEVKERKVCQDEGFKWGGEDVRMGKC